jgi:hypothetical protein
MPLRLTLLLVSWLVAFAGLVDPAAAGQRIGVLDFEAVGVAPQLAKRLRATVLSALTAEGQHPADLSEDYAFLAECRFPVDCYSAVLPGLGLNYLMTVQITQAARAAAGPPEQKIKVRIGRMPWGRSTLGPWLVSTTCRDCSDSELSDSTRQIVLSAWKGMARAELSPEEIEVPSSDRRNKGAKLLRLADDEERPGFERVYLLKQAIRAGAGAAAHLRLAEIFLLCGAYAEAEDQAAQAAAKGGKADGLMGLILWSTGRWAEALPVYARLVRANPRDDHYQSKLDELERRTHDYRPIAAQAAEALSLNNLSKAEQLARIALLSARPERKARLVLAATSLKSLAYADALAQYLAVLQADPDNQEALAGRRIAEEAMRRPLDSPARR